MNRGRRESPHHGTMVLSAATPPASGIVRRDAAADAPPWDVVLAYLTRGEHRDWVEGCAQRVRAFADVLAALRNEMEEAGSEGRGGKIIPLR